MFSSLLIIKIFILIFYFPVHCEITSKSTISPCSYDAEKRIVNCDGKGLTNFTGLEFPPDTQTLTLVNNRLRFDQETDRAKLESLKNLKTLVLDQNPLGVIPPFRFNSIQSISLHETSLSSTEFPITFLSATNLARIHLSQNQIRTIGENDFISLRNSPVKTIDLNDINLSKINSNAFIPLKMLESISLNRNQLKSAEFFPSLKSVGTIHLDGNQFTSLPAQITDCAKAKVFSFRQNLITSLDDSSVLNLWEKMNRTDVKISLANNSFDCCQSTWFIAFLQRSSHFIDDAKFLKCSQPTDIAGKSLLEIRESDLNCGSANKWHKIVLISSTISAGGVALGLSSLAFVYIRRRKHKCGYTEIDGITESTPTEPIFPPYGDDDDKLSDYSTFRTAPSTVESC